MQTSEINHPFEIATPTKPKFRLRDSIHRACVRFDNWNAQRRCAHLYSNPVDLMGPIGSPQMHPHPLFRDKIQVRLQPFARVQVCFFCQKVKSAFGHNEHAIESTLPGLDLGERIPKRA